MTFFDMLSLSVMNLWKRKARTILTVMGVTIGVASIVVMVSLGLGLNKAMMEDIQNYASMTAITVRPGDTSAANEKDRKYLTDDLISAIERMDHVDYVAPILSVSVIAKYGAYTAWLDLEGTTLEYLQDINIDVGQGSLPTAEMNDLELFFGNMILMQFYSRAGQSYWDTGELPDIDLMNDSILYVLDTDAWYASQNGSSGEDKQPVKPPKKHLLKTAGVALKLFGQDLPNHFDREQYAMCWIVDFPMYEIGEESGELEFCPNPQLSGHGEYAGLVVTGNSYAALQLRDTAEGIVLEYLVCEDAHKGGLPQTVATLCELPCTEVDIDHSQESGNVPAVKYKPYRRTVLWVRLQVTPGADASVPVCRFSYSSDGRRWTAVPGSFEARPELWIGAKAGFYCLRPAPKNDAGFLSVRNITIN